MEENKPVETPVEIPVETTPAVEPATPTTPVEEPKQEGDEPTIDYKAEYEKTAAKLKKAEYTLYKKNKEDKEEPYEPPVEDIEAIVDQKVNAKLSTLHQDLAGNIIEDTLNFLSSDPEEQKLIRLHYDNSIVKTGLTRQAIVEDLRKAQLLANAPKYLREKEEYAEAMKAKATVGKTAYGSNNSRATVKEDYTKYFKPHELEHMKRVGFTDDMIKKAALKAKAQKQ